jgi:hypothetical protein
MPPWLTKDKLQNALTETWSEPASWHDAGNPGACLSPPKDLAQGASENKAGLQPFGVGVAGGFNAENDELWGLVAVPLVKAGFESGELIGAGLEQQQGFGSGLDLALPMVNGLDGRDHCDAGSEALFDESAGEAIGFLSAGCGG